MNDKSHKSKFWWYSLSIAHLNQNTQWVKKCLIFYETKRFLKSERKYRDSPDSMVFAHPAGTVLLQNRTNRELVLKLWFMNFKVPFFAHFHEKTVLNLGLSVLRKRVDV
jgi:hypothetical protein